MANIFVVSDTHFSHTKCWSTFVKRDGSGEMMRPFKSDEEMDDYMITKWNSVVRPQDKVYHLGDVAIKKSAIAQVGKCNGHKRLLRGNHDIYDTKEYLKFFEEIYAYRVLDNMILSHIPLHPDCMGRFGVNVHGHVHNNVPPGHFGSKYFNVSVEEIDYTPVSLEDLKVRIRKQQNYDTATLNVLDFCAETV